MEKKAIQKIKKPSKKKQNLEPIQPKPELSYQDIVKECERCWKSIENSITFEDYKAQWDCYDKYNKLKLNYKK